MVIDQHHNDHDDDDEHLDGGELLLLQVAQQVFECVLVRRPLCVRPTFGDNIDISYHCIMEMKVRRTLSI